MTFDTLKSIDEEYGTPFYLMDVCRFASNIAAFRDAFTSRYDRIVIGYSFKTNYIPSLCLLAKEAGCFAEVVSEMEYSLAKKLGFENIIFNGPIKKTAVLLAALEDGAIVNLDSLYEVEEVLKYRRNNPERKIKVGLRLNIDLTDALGNSKVQCGLKVGRFGFNSALLQRVVARFREYNIKIVSLHGHTSSSDRAVANYKLIVRQMLDVCAMCGLDDLKYFDVGGGYFGAAAKGIDVTGKPTYSDYANCILDECFEDKWFAKVQPYIVIEPGVSVVANAFSYVSKIFQVKDIAGQMFVTTDGTVFDVKPTLHNNNLPHAFYTEKDNCSSFKANLVGSTCMEKDIILKDVSVPSAITNGDYVKIDGVGAYTIALSPTFINFLSPIIGIDKNGRFRVRRRQNINDVISLYDF